MKTAVLLYDSDCGFCRWSVDKILSWDRRRCLRPLALQDPEADRLLGVMIEDVKMSSWHLVTDDGRVYSGGAAAAPLFRLLPRGRPLAAVFAAFPGLTNGGYRLVARNRDRFGRLVGQTACEVDPSRRNRT
jgi:predicted DCC family thiol-disulfide oxidoreductase YuxK